MGQRSIQIFDTWARALAGASIYRRIVLYRRLIANGVNAARIGSLVGPPPTASGTPSGGPVVAVLQARAGLEAPRQKLPEPEQRQSASA